MRVATVTFNPALDRTIALDRLTRGEVHRARMSREDAGGKGVNVASCLADWGQPVTAFGLLGADNAGPFEALCALKPIEDGFVRVPGATRVNLKIVDDQTTTDINMDGPWVDEANIEALVDAILAYAGEDALVVLSGSLPPGCPPDIYADLVARLKAIGTHVLLDTSGTPLALALGGGILPDIVKPNRDELAAWAGVAAGDMEALLGAAIRLRRQGVDLVVVSMGADGALFLSEEGSLIARLKAFEVNSTVGAGDAMVAGIAAAMIEGASLERTARLATAFAVAKLGRPGPHLPSLATVHALADDTEILVARSNDAALLGEAK